MEPPPGSREYLFTLNTDPRRIAVNELKKILTAIRARMTPEIPEPGREELAWLSRLGEDPRKSVQRLLTSCREHLKNVRAERRRLLGLYSLEADLSRRGIGPVCGIDEAGRGPLAGPVVAAAVILRRPLLVAGMDDSKRMTPREREELYEQLVRSSDALIGVGIVSHRVIDRVNILNATMLAMREAVAELPVRPAHALVDGMNVRGLALPQTKIIGGDGRCAAIACASIVAKVTRDRMMGEIARRLPDWDFEMHKGYGTGEHLARIRERGPSIIHRLSFGGVKEHRR